MHSAMIHLGHYLPHAEIDRGLGVYRRWDLNHLAAGDAEFHRKLHVLSGLFERHRCTTG